MLANHFFPAIPGMEALFGEPLFTFKPNTKPGIGFRRKSSIVIEGPPGSGKTAATLAICRALMPSQASLMYYLSTEVTKERLFKNHAEFGWFKDFGKLSDADSSKHGYPFTKENLFFAELPRARTDRPLPSSAEQINDIFRGISDYRRKPDRRGHPSLIVVDSLSGLLRDASTSGDRRRLTEDFLERLETEFDNDLGLVFLITESSMGRSEETPLEQYVADYVFRLGYKEAPGGRRVRTWDIVKSHGTYMAAGEHTWDFYTDATDDSLFFDSELRRYLWEYREMQLDAAQRLSAKETSVDGDVANGVNDRFPPERPTDPLPPAATIVIYPQWSTYLDSPRGKPAKKSTPPAQPKTEDYIWSGTPGLDELLQGDTEYWSRPDKWSQRYHGAKWTPGLRPGETTLLLGSSGTLKSWISMQFLAGNIHADGVIELSTAKTSRIRAYCSEASARGERWRDKNTLYAFYGPTLFLSFEGESSAIKGFRRTSRDLGDLLECASLIYASPASLHINRLLFELRWICRARRVERIAIDGLAELIKCVEPGSRIGVVTALFRTLQNAYSDIDGVRTRPTIFATYELTPHDRSLIPESDGVSAICENVLILQQIHLNDQMHKAIYVLKAKDSRHDTQIREIVINPRDTGKTPGVRVQSGFEGFSDLLSGAPKKARVALQLFCENSAERKYNEKIRDRLSQTFAFKVTLHAFAHSELSQFLDDVRGILGQVPATDIKVITLDEWWLRDLQRAPDVPQTEESDAPASPCPLLRVDGFFALKDGDPKDTKIFPMQAQRSAATNQGLASEHWITEVEKGVRTTDNSLSPVERNKSANQSDPAKKDSTAFCAEIDAELQAMPHYSDFGLFCVNSRLASESEIFADMRLVSRDQLCNQLPVLWARPAISPGGHNWFTSVVPKGNLKGESKYSTIAELLFDITERGQHPERGFNFDMSQGETAVCVLMELAWSFGVPEGFLSEAAINLVLRQELTSDNHAAEAMRSALRLLQFLVFHGLMLPYPVAQGSSKALLSRQWYSTMNIAGGVATEHEPVDVAPVSSPNTSASEKNLTQNGTPIDLVPIPYFPVGMLPCDIEYGIGRLVLAELVDIRNHLSGICHRVSAALDWISDYRRNIVPENGRPLIASTLLKKSSDAVEPNRVAVTRLQELLTESKFQLQALGVACTPEMYATVTETHARLGDLANELLEIASRAESGLSGRQLRWKPFEISNPDKTKLPLMASERRRWVAAGMAMDIRDVRQMLAWFKTRLDLLGVEIQSIRKKASSTPVALRGFACSGSWMLGVRRNTHSPGLSWKLIEEMTSRESNALRAEMGAGIPTRKDFYDFHGKTMVPRIPQGFQVSWSDFLTLAGAKVRRRDRALCSKVPLSQFSALVRAQMIRCVDAAQAARKSAADDRHEDWSQPPSEDALQLMNGVVDDAVRQILLYIAIVQQKGTDSKPSESDMRTDPKCDFCPRGDLFQGNFTCGAGLQPASEAATTGGK